MNLFCWTRGLWRSLSSTWLTRSLTLVSGHDYETVREPTPPNVHIIECALCGARSLGWAWGSMEK